MITAEYTMQAYLHSKFHIGPHDWHLFNEEKLFDPANPAIHTATRIRKRCACGKMLTTIEPTGNAAAWRNEALAEIL